MTFVIERGTFNLKKDIVRNNKSKDTHINNNLFFRAYENVKYELPILILLLTLSLQNKSDVATSDVYTMLHIFDYRIGFAPRLFIGSIMSIFTNYKSVAFMNRFMTIFCIVTLVLFAVVAGQIVRKFDKNSRKVPIFFIIIFLAIPYSRLVLYPGSIISVDRFLVVFTLMALIAMDKPIIKWSVPILIFMGLATYHGFAFMHMPAIALLLLYMILHNKRSKENIALFIISFVTMAVFSAYFFLYQGIEMFKNVDELLAYASDKTDLSDYLRGFDIREILDAFLLGGSKDFFQDYRVVAGWEWTGLKLELIGIIYLMPLFVIFFMIWKNSIKTSLDKSDKIIYLLCILAPLARLPMFLFSSNYLRGRSSIVVVQFFLVFYFLYVGNEVVIESAKQVVGFFKRYPLLFLLMVVYFAFFVKFL